MTETDGENLLADARARADALVKELLRREAEMGGSVRGLTQDQLAAGRLALRRAVDAAQRLLHSIDRAMDKTQEPSA